MASNRGYTLEGRQFKTESEYRLACRDRDLIRKLQPKLSEGSDKELVQIKQLIKAKKIKFHTILGSDFEEEIDRELKRREDSRKMEKIVDQEIKKRNLRRRLVIGLCSLAAAGCFLYLGVYSYFTKRTSDSYEKYAELKEKNAESRTASSAPVQESLVIHYDTKEEGTPEVLEEFKDLLNINKKLIGWLKIDDTIIDYPVMQTSDNEYYLTHNLNQEYDINGSIFLDKDCDIVEPSTNFILYGHHMKSGKMFGALDKYKSEKYWEKHRFITFDTIYEHGTYEVMYVFQGEIYKESDVKFKYYQFIDAYSATEFDSYMQEMAQMSLYDTGVSAEFGDHLLTLSTCDESTQANGRFVVVAKKVKSE